MDRVLQQIGERLAEKLTYTDDEFAVTYPFVNRWTTGFLDDTFIENNEIADGSPYLSIYGSPIYTRSWQLVRSAKKVSDITHVGKSDRAFNLTGIPIGAFSYVVEIVLGGLFGTATYKLSNDGGSTFGTTTIVPQGGNIAIGDGSTLVFSSIGVLVAEDTYSWETEMLREDVYRSYTFVGTIALEIVAANSGEFSGILANTHIGYRDQLLDLFSEKSGITIDALSWAHITIDQAPTVILDDRISMYRGLVSVLVEGELYITRTVVMAETVVLTPVIS